MWDKQYGKPDTGFDLLWDELGALEDANGKPMQIKNFEEFTRTEFSDGEELIFYANADRFGEELRCVAPDDSELVDRLISELKYMSGFKVSVVKEKGSIFSKIGSFLSNLGTFRCYLKHLRTPIGEHAGRWKSKYVREALCNVIPPSWSLGSLTMGLAMQHTGCRLPGWRFIAVFGEYRKGISGVWRKNLPWFKS